MCEVLLRVIDKVNEDPYKDCKLLKKGDVVIICPDGWSWSIEEKTNPDWRILKLPNISKEFAEAFTSPEIDTDPQNPSNVLRRRSHFFDLDNLLIKLSKSFSSKIIL